MAEGRRAQGMRISTGFLNTVNDAVPGSTVASPTGNLEYVGLLGQELELTSAQALALSKTTIGTLYAGRYKYVKTLSSATAAPARGLVAVWSDEDNYVVNSDVAATTVGRAAGVFISAPTKGNYCFIQVEGKATLQCHSSVGGTTAGDLAMVDTTTGAVLAVADATAGGVDTALEAKKVIGTFIEAPANSGLKTALVRFTRVP